MVTFITKYMFWDDNIHYKIIFVYGNIHYKKNFIVFQKLLPFNEKDIKTNVILVEMMCTNGS